MITPSNEAPLPWTVLIVDDEPDRLGPIVEALAVLGKCSVVAPEDVAASDLLTADLVLVDLTLEHVEWANSYDSPIAQRPLDGLALTNVLRSHTTGTTSERRPLFALHTGHIGQLVPDLPAEIEENVAARLNNLEWVFRKTEAAHGQRLAKRIAVLAEASANLPVEWTTQGSSAEQFTLELLGVDSELPWSKAAYGDVRSCHPPLFELAEKTHGLSFIRWMLHRILPYPSFILSERRLAHRLRLDYDIVARMLDDGSDGLSELLRPSLYGGALAGFDGRRWWRAGVDDAIASLGDGDPFNLTLIEQRLSELCVEDLTFNSPSDVLNLDGDYKVCGTGLRSKSVRISPEDWPPYADQAFASAEDAAADERLRRIVHVDDLHELETP